jgi:hypothetical protein
MSAIAKVQALADGHQIVIEITWVLGHEDVEGNEKADEAAKEAAKSDSKRPPYPEIQVQAPQIGEIPMHKARNHRQMERIIPISSTKQRHRLLRIIKKPNALCGNKLYNAVELTASNVPTRQTLVRSLFFKSISSSIW